MHILLLSRFIGAVPGFLDSIGLTSRTSTRIAYVDDASKPLGSLPFVEEERRQLQQLGYSVVPVTVGNGTAEDFTSTLESVDAVYVAGGMADYLMATLRRVGADTVLSERVRAGLPYMGASAGAMVTGRSIEPAIALDGHTEGIMLEDFSGLNLVDLVIVPHADGLLPLTHLNLSPP
ncbi:type 1 glutamine amidotransferase-like domain-containing protein [Leucobacter coleopterorum]|uniref:Type 1 glutamine amidotransferase-like domain-containing protein n=1 Tax=Leucobacter coleopterorum TaxID=2714933 RepID=A0ABX6JV50_9MICO|nr:Type 1 glutamine amidotransferase-like domain-containing protein [Leucobacter coleopterorum]QIM18186.1 type 1 glutamine amidotransferase-like domain-containing protein [Leucobacter coleopterorum]